MHMISVEEAKERIIKSTSRIAPANSPTSKSLLSVLSSDVISPICYPPFNQSSMDGFAILFSDFKEQNEIEVIGEAPAGNPFTGKIRSGQAVRVFTGSQIPEGADTVVMQEKVIIEKDNLVVHDSELVCGDNVRKKGSHIKEGEVALKSGTMLTPAAIGYLAGLGTAAVNIFPVPKVTVIVTGNELQSPGNSLADGHVYESNSTMLQTALASVNIGSAAVTIIKDDENLITETIANAVVSSDMVIISGGISVGKYDYVHGALGRVGVQNIFYKVHQKPGKPLFFGKHKRCLIYALPGNPASVLTCFYEYVYPALRIMQGYSNPFMKQIHLPVSSNFNKNSELSFFLKGKIAGDAVEILQGQESNNMGSFALADCLVYLPEGKMDLTKGQSVEVHLLP